MIKVGITEIDIGYEDKEYAREHCLEVMQEAYENGVELLVFPEMTLTGFTMMPARMWEAYRDGEIPESVSLFHGEQQEIRYGHGIWLYRSFHGRWKR